ncbi:MAG TPA: hypothetical protein DCM28_17970 [Phycisphaerales bacterium]|nr:hypothetical protein [Phycisphaerales bacterium]|tara:strand:+ start:451 stop:675 length:225 start_codon:yes stop_codon:yes gene_type:complete
MSAKTKQQDTAESIYISPNELSERWQCSRSSVDRIAQRSGMTRICLGEGRNGIVRYLRDEALAFESERTIKLKP